MSSKEDSTSPEEHERKAEKLLSGGKSLFASFLGGGSKTEEAASHYESAGLGYKNKKQFKESGRAYEKAADLYDRTESGFLDSRGPRQSALDVYILANMVDDAARAGTILVDKAKHSSNSATAVHRTLDKLGLLYEQAGDSRRAVQMYEESAEAQLLNSSPRNAYRAFEKAAELAAASGDYRKGYEAFMELGDKVVDAHATFAREENPFLKHYFRAAICKFADSDIEGANQVIRHVDNQWSKVQTGDYWKREDPSWYTRQGLDSIHFLQVLHDQVKNNDQNAFVETLKSYKQPLPNPVGSIIQRIIQQVEEPQEDFS